MRVSKKSSFAALVVAAAAVTALGAAGAQGSATPQKKVETSHAKVDSAFLAQESAASKHVKSTVASRTALTTVQTRIAGYVKAHGTKYTFGSYSDPATGAVVIQTNAPASLVSSLSSFKGLKGLSTVKVTTKKGAITDSYNRRDDIPAYYAGGGIYSGGFLCSDGYPVQNSAGYRYMVTAGHCFANGANVLTESGLRSEGNVTGRQLASLGNGPVDMELLYGQSYWGRVFTGDVNSSTSTPIVAAGTAYVGYNNYCHSGRTTGEQCGHTAQSITAQVCTQTGCKSPVIAFTGGVMIQGGDSGGSFYAKDSAGNAWIRGHILASGGGTGYAEPYTVTAARYGVTIVTGT